MGILRAPDGRTIQVPDGATPEQVQAIFQASSEMKREASAEAARDAAWEETPWYGKAAIGFAKPFVETGIGIKSLFTDLDQDDKNLLDAGKGVKGAAGVGGEIAGNLATFALPGGAAGRVGTKAVSMLPNATRLARGAVRAAPQVAALSGMEALKAPTDERSRSDAALQGATGALLGAGAGHVLGRTLRGITQSKAGREMLEDGIELTPGMAAKGSFIPWLEQRMAALPAIGGKVANLQGKALGQWNRQTLQSVAPAGSRITQIGQKGFQEVQEAFGKSYSAIWDRQIPLRGNPSQVWADLIEASARTVAKKETKQIFRNLTQVDEVLKVAQNMARARQNNGNIYSQVDDMLRGFIKQAQRKGDDQVVAIYKQARSAFREALPQQVNRALKAVDDQYAKFSVVQRAGSYKKALENDSIFTPSHLMGAVKARGSERALTRGNALLQQDAAKAVDLFEGLLPASSKLEKGALGLAAGYGAIMEPVTAGMALVGGLALPREVTRKLMTGYYRKRPQELAEVLRQYGVTPSTVVAATGSAVNDSGR